MSTTFDQNATPQQEPRKRDNRNIVYGVLIAALLGTWGYMLYKMNRDTGTIQQKDMQLASADSSKSAVQMQFDAAMSRLDSLNTDYNSLKSDKEALLKDKNAEIANLKAEIRSILNNKNATKSELATAQQKISELNAKIDGLVAEVERLKGENQQLTAQNIQITGERDRIQRDLDTVTNVKKELEKTVEVGSTLNANNFNITPINEKRSGKEKVTTSAKRVDKLRIEFDVENKIAKSGNTDIYVVITDPEGKPISVESLGSGSFTTRDGVQRTFSKKVDLDYATGERKHVNVEWKQSDFKRGNYKIEVYQNGFKIGEGVRELKRGGLFG
jgi:myosin heavy subunit